MKEYELKKDQINEWRGWPVMIDELCEKVLMVKHRHVMRAIIALGMVKTWTDEESGKERASKAGFQVMRRDALEIWEWIYTHLERRVYDPKSKSRAVAGQTGCAWISRWSASASQNDPLPDEVKAFFAEEKRYTGRMISQFLGISPFRVSRVGIRLGYRGGQYLACEARHIANCIIRGRAAIKADSRPELNYRKATPY